MQKEEKYRISLPISQQAILAAGEKPNCMSRARQIRSACLEGFKRLLIPESQFYLATVAPNKHSGPCPLELAAASLLFPLCVYWSHASWLCIPTPATCYTGKLFES